MELTCPLPEEQNTRGRKLHPPELAPQAFGILTLKQIPKVNYQNLLLLIILRSIKINVENRSSKIFFKFHILLRMYLRI